ncbi:threonine/serine dehydratase [Bhargavaea ullalensis]|uniref:Threonine dehydratase n=1 Tax=Bhargavaea ullalensis TaxID=1265685 RepID=A0ABV2G8F7_9BACL
MIELGQIRTAAEKIGGMIHRTPVLTSERLGRIAGCRVHLKAEHLQKTGSFKIRGASFKILQAVEEGAVHAVAASSGNHGQAVARAAAMMGLRATIVVPEDASPAKIAAIKAYGGQVVKCGRTSAERIPEAVRIAHEEGGVFIPPYDDEFIMAGQGTAGLELVEQVPSLDAVFVPVGGGGLLAGVLSAVRQLRPGVRVYGVEPESADDTRRSLAAGERVSIGPSATIADGLRTSIPGELTFPILKSELDGLITVSDSAIRDSMAILFEATKQVVEPSGATALAGLLSENAHGPGKEAVVILSGGNIAPADYARLIR